MTQRNTGSEWFQCHPPKETHSMGMGTIWLSRFNIFMEGTIDDNMNTTRLTLKEPVGWRTRRIGWRKLQLTGGFVNEYCIWGVDWSKREFQRIVWVSPICGKTIICPPSSPPRRTFLIWFFQGARQFTIQKRFRSPKDSPKEFPKGIQATMSRGLRIPTWS